MKTEESLYVKIITWAYEKSATGFTDQELLDKFSLKEGNGEQYKMYVKIFRNGTIDNPSLIDQYKYEDNKHYFCLSERGMAAAIDYLDLKEARESSKEAKTLAMWSIWIAILVGLAQVVLAIIQVICN